MPIEITMPQLGLTMEQGTVVRWLVQPGDEIEPGQEILEIETDKAVVAIEAHDVGTLERILVAEGQEAPVGTVLGLALAPGEVLPPDWQLRQPLDEELEVDVEVAAASPSAPIPIPDKIADSTEAGPVRASWKARAMARQAGLDLHTLVGSGPRGRVVAQDISRASAIAAAVPTGRAQATPVAANLAASLGLDLSRVSGTGHGGRITQEDVLALAAAVIQGQATVSPVPEPGLPQVARTTPLKGVRRIVSEGMATSAHTTARVTLFREVDASELQRLRERFRDQEFDVSYNDLLVRICAVALRDHPQANARLGEGQIEQLDRINIGLAVDTERGLLVPVVRDADRLGIPQIAAETRRLVEDARSGRSLPDDLSGGTFTITNLGMLGVEGFTPVINLPECCILGAGRMVRKPVVVGQDDTVAVRSMMTISLVFDHRAIDGAPAARFMDRIAQLIEHPELLLVIG
jgi:pyruvate dehydrogenase E2 component (dihydrolipoamide acetyltransferase)